MNIQDFSKLIRQTPTTIRTRCKNGDIPAKQVFTKKWGGWKRWEIDDNYIKDLIGEK